MPGYPKGWVTQAELEREPRVMTVTECVTFVTELEKVSESVARSIIKTLEEAGILVRETERGWGGSIKNETIRLSTRAERAEWGLRR